MTTKINLNDLDWGETPANQDLCFGEWASLPQEDGGEAQFIVDYDIDGTRKARLVVDDSLSTVKTAFPGRWASSTDTADWPVLDALFGREQWQTWLAEKTEEMRERDDEALED
jgi:hypothetical protein